MRWPASTMRRASASTPNSSRPCATALACASTSRRSTTRLPFIPASKSWPVHSRLDTKTMGDDFSQRFQEQYEAGSSQLVWRRVVADLETPIGTYLKLASGRHNTFLLESVQDGTVRGRYSIIGSQPDLMLKVENGVAA